MRVVCFSTVSLVLVAAVATPGRAQITFNNSQTQAVFTASLNAVPAPYTETFALLNYSPGPVTQAFLGPAPTNHYGYNITALDGLYANNAIFGSDNDNRALTIATTLGAINAIGANVFVTDIDNVFLGVPITITATNALGQTNNITYTPTSANQFLGIRSPTSNLTSVVFSAPGVNNFASMDNLVVGFVPVPEPSLMLAGAAGLGLIGSVLRRRFRPGAA